MLLEVVSRHWCAGVADEAVFPAGWCHHQYAALFVGELFTSHVRLDSWRRVLTRGHVRRVQGARLEVQQAAKLGKELNKVEAIAAFGDNTGGNKALQLKRFRQKTSGKVETDEAKMRKSLKPKSGAGKSGKGKHSTSKRKKK
eukprot:1194597-Prorocentrum_minimum.AAC.1